MTFIKLTCKEILTETYSEPQRARDWARITFTKQTCTDMSMETLSAKESKRLNSSGNCKCSDKKH